MLIGTFCSDVFRTKTKSQKPKAKIKTNHTDSLTSSQWHSIATRLCSARTADHAHSERVQQHSESIGSRVPPRKRVFARMHKDLVGKWLARHGPLRARWGHVNNVWATSGCCDCSTHSRAPPSHVVKKHDDCSIWPANAFRYDGGNVR